MTLSFMELSPLIFALPLLQMPSISPRIIVFFQRILPSRDVTEIKLLIKIIV